MTALSFKVCALRNSVGIVNGSYNAARLLLGYNALAAKIACAVFSIFLCCSSVGEGHGKLLYTMVFE